MVVPWYDNKSSTYDGDLTSSCIFLMQQINFHHEVTSCVSTQAVRSLFLSHQKWPFISPLNLLCVQRVFTFNTRMWPVVEITGRFSNQKNFSIQKRFFMHRAYVSPFHMGDIYTQCTVYFLLSIVLEKIFFILHFISYWIWVYKQ